MSNQEKKFRITVSESQLRMISACVEDIHRFMSGDLDLYNCTSMLDDMHALPVAKLEAKAAALKAKQEYEEAAALRHP